MKVKIVKDACYIIRDTFLYAPNELFKIITQNVPPSCYKEGGIAVRCVPLNIEGKKPYYGWLVSGPSYLNSKDFIRSASIDGEFLIETVPIIEQAHRIVLSVYSREEYELIATRAEEIINRLFLQQIRIVQKGITLELWIDEAIMTKLKVEKIYPENLREVSRVGLDSEVEIILAIRENETIDDGNAFHKVSADSNMKRVRARRLVVGASKCKAVMNPNVLSSCSYCEEKEGFPTTVIIFVIEKREKLTVLLDKKAPDGWIWIVDEQMRQWNLVQHEWITIKDPSICATSEDSFLTLQEFGYKHSLFNEVNKVLQLLMHPDVPTRGMFIAGESMVGKSCLFKDLLDHGNVPLYYGNCGGATANNSLQSKQKLIKEIIQDALKIAPCVIVFDHVENFFKGIADTEQDGASVFFMEQFTLWFLEKVRFLLSLHSPVVLATIVVDELCSPLKMSSLFIKTLTIDRPRADLRRLLLQGSNDDDDANELFVKRTAGMLPLEILKTHGCDQAVSPPSSLISLVPQWKDIVGLDYAKKQLIENILWPLLYVDLFRANGFDRAGGSLITGPTGVGKTLLVKSFAKYVLPPHVAVITVLGPSLLGKYLGSSEQAVRDVFIRARSRRPALILIEELDALAPRRGLDNTGTTDRVVDQLLTELDGTGELKDVFVLATSSRPDLIDPAVIRSGRIDGRIALHLPNQSERAKLVTMFIPKSLKDEHALIEQLADSTEGWSPAHFRGFFVDVHTDRCTFSTTDLLEAFVHYKSDLLSNPKNGLGPLTNHKIALA